MNKKSKIAVLTATIILCLAVITESVFMMYGWGTFVKIVCYAIPAVGIAFSITVFVLDKQPLLKSCFILMVCAFVIISSFALLSVFARLNEYPTDEQKITRVTEIIKSTGSWGMLVYVLIQVLQVVILPLPAVVCYVPGSIIWGAPVATLLASVGVLTGSVIAYFIGRLFGKKVVVWIAGSETVEKYTAYIGSKGKVIFLLMQILPFFPDDILCMVAGLASMNFAYFITVMVVVRPAIIALYCFLGNGSLIPFSGWGIPVWIAIFAVCIVLAVLSLKYHDRVEKWLVSRFSKKNKEEESKED
ncbi:MAG: VTT domain-containing protein [Clostridia bacterium]|nr:VTT domain-containing protein [Clostridia bacterium]